MVCAPRGSTQCFATSRKTVPRSGYINIVDWADRWTAVSLSLFMCHRLQNAALWRFPALTSKGALWHLSGLGVPLYGAGNQGIETGRSQNKKGSNNRTTEVRKLRWPKGPSVLPFMMIPLFSSFVKRNSSAGFGLRRKYCSLFLTRLAKTLPLSLAPGGTQKNSRWNMKQKKRGNADLNSAFIFC